MTSLPTPPLSAAEVDEKIRFLFREVTEYGYGALNDLRLAFPGAYINDCVNVIDALLHSIHWAEEWRDRPLQAYADSGEFYHADPQQVVDAIAEHRAEEHDASAVYFAREFVTRWQRMAA